MARPQLTAKEALQHHQNLIYRRALEKLQSEQPLDDDELAEVKRREAEEAKQKPKREPQQRGQKSKLTRELIGKLRAHVAAGNTVKNACLVCQIGQSTFYHWLQDTDSNNPLLLELREALKEAEAEAEANMVQMIKNASRDNWTAAAWYLERRNPDVWGKRETIRAEHSGPNGAPLLHSTTQIVVYMPDNGRAVQAVEQSKIGNGT